MIEISNLTVRFGGVTPIDDMNLSFGVGTNGLIGPNGAGKTTFFNVLSGFVRPARGSVTAFGDDLLAMPDFRRVRWGLRRTFQTEQAIASLSVYENVLIVHEHSGAPAATRRSDVIDAIEFVGLGRRIRELVSTLGPPSGGWSRSPGRSSASRGWCCSTSRPPGCPTTRRPRSAR